MHAVLIPDGSGRSLDEIVREANLRLDTLHQITGYSLWAGAGISQHETTLKIRKFLVKEQMKKGRESAGKGVVADRLIDILASVTGTGIGDISENSFLVADLGLTSIGRLELVNYLEQEYRLDLEDSMIGPETRVEDLRLIIAKREKLAGGEEFRFWTNSPFVRSTAWHATPC